MEENVPDEIRHDREMFYIDKYNSLAPNGYNNAYAASHPHTEEHKQHMSEIMTGRPKSDETRQKISEVRLSMNITHTEEEKQKISKSGKKVWQNPEYHDKMVNKRKEYWNTPEAHSKASQRTKEWMSKLTTEERQKFVSQRKPLAVFNVKTRETITFPSMKEAFKYVGIKRPSAQSLATFKRNRKIFKNKYIFE